MDDVAGVALHALEGAPDVQDASSPADCLLLGFVHRLSGAPEKAVPFLRAAVLRLGDPATPDSIRMSIPTVMASMAGTELLDNNATHDVINAYVRSSAPRWRGVGPPLGVGTPWGPPHVPGPVQ